MQKSIIQEQLTHIQDPGGSWVWSGDILDLGSNKIIDLYGIMGVWWRIKIPAMTAAVVKG